MKLYVTAGLEQALGYIGLVGDSEALSPVLLFHGFRQAGTCMIRQLDDYILTYVYSATVDVDGMSLDAYNLYSIVRADSFSSIDRASSELPSS